MTKQDFNSIKTAINDVCEAYEQSDSPEALAHAFYQLYRVRDTILKDNDRIFNRDRTSQKAVNANGTPAVHPARPSPSPILDREEVPDSYQPVARQTDAGALLVGNLLRQYR